jgi:hypothetical protein
VLVDQRNCQIQERAGRTSAKKEWLDCWLLVAACWLLVAVSIAVCCLLSLLFACHFNLTVWLLFAVNCYVNFVVGSFISFLG